MNTKRPNTSSGASTGASIFGVPFQRNTGPPASTEPSPRVSRWDICLLIGTAALVLLNVVQAFDQKAGHVEFGRFLVAWTFYPLGTHCVRIFAALHFIGGRC